MYFQTQPLHFPVMGQSSQPLQRGRHPTMIYLYPMCIACWCLQVKMIRCVELSVLSLKTILNVRSWLGYGAPPAGRLRQCESHHYRVLTSGGMCQGRGGIYISEPTRFRVTWLSISGTITQCIVKSFSTLQPSVNSMPNHVVVHRATYA